MASPDNTSVADPDEGSRRREGRTDRLEPRRQVPQRHGVRVERSATALGQRDRRARRNPASGLLSVEVGGVFDAYGCDGL